MIKTIRAYRGAPPEEDYSWALAMSENERLDVTYRLVRALWATAHGGEPFPSMDRSIAGFVGKLGSRVSAASSKPQNG